MHKFYQFMLNVMVCSINSKQVLFIKLYIKNANLRLLKFATLFDPLFASRETHSLEAVMKTTGGTQAQCCNKSWIFKLIGLRQNYRLAQPTSTRCRRRNMPRRHGYPLFRQPPPSCWSPKN